MLAAKRAVVEGYTMPLADGLRLEVEQFLTINASDEAQARNASARSSGRPIDQG